MVPTYFLHMQNQSGKSPAKLAVYNLVSLLLLSAGIHLVSGEVSSDPQLSSPLVLVPEFHFDGDIGKFAFHSNEFFKERYLVEAKVKMDVALLRYNSTFLIIGLDIHSGMGYQDRDIVFDPIDVNYGILPILEHRFENLTVQGGLEHRCYHEIDRREFPTVYYNKLFLGAGTPNMHLADFWKNLTQEDSWSWKNRIQAYVRWGYFAKEMFGLVKPVLVDGGNPKTQETAASVRFAFAKAGEWVVFSTRAMTEWGGWKFDNGDKVAFWRQMLGVEAMIIKSPKGGIFFIDYYLDDLPLTEGRPRFSKHGLMLFGLRFFL